MKYENVDWSRWPEAPSKEVYEDWIEARKSKKHPTLTQTAINKYGKHLCRLVRENICSVEMSVEFAAERGWRAIFYSYVITALNSEMDGYSSPIKDTRSLSLQGMFNNDWAEDLTNKLN